MLPAVGLQVSGRDDCGDQARRIALYIAKLPQPFAISYGMAVSPIPPPMAPNSPDAFQSARPAAERITEGTQETITNYFAWLQSAMQASPWGNTDLNKKLMSYATETVTAPLNLAQ